MGRKPEAPEILPGKGSETMVPHRKGGIENNAIKLQQ